MKHRYVAQQIGRPALRFAAVSVGIVAVIGAAMAGFASPVTAQQRSVVVVGDSVILGAQSPMVAAFSNAGWGVVFDAVVSRSTSAGAAAIDSRRMELTDSLVVNLGANDAGNTAAYRQKVGQILSSTAGVPHVYWLTIREVRDYYPAANQAVREVAAAFPNVTVLDWNAATAGSSGLTASDGLHLTAAGALAMTDLVAGAVVNSGGPQAAPAAAPPPEPQTAPPEPAAVVPLPTETIPPSSLAVTSLPPTTLPPASGAAPAANNAQSRSTDLPQSADSSKQNASKQNSGKQNSGKQMEQAMESGGSDIGSVLRWTIGGGFAAVVLLLALSGAVLGGWALIGAGEKIPE
ncbi:MAG: hypothetical protein WD029_03205 [Microthrixaceae bacterium]